MECRWADSGTPVWVGMEVVDVIRWSIVGRSSPSTAVPSYRARGTLPPRECPYGPVRVSEHPATLVLETATPSFFSSPAWSTAMVTHRSRVSRRLQRQASQQDGQSSSPTQGIWVCTGPSGPWASFWAGLRHLG